LIEAAASSLLVVASLSGDAASDASERQQHEERRGLDRRVHDLAVSQAYDAAGLLCVSQAVLYGFELGSLSAEHVSHALSQWWVGAAALGWSLWLSLLLVFRYAYRRQGDTRHWRRLLNTAVLLNLTVAAAFVWLPQISAIPASQALGLVSVLGGSLLVALSLPMLPHLGSTACGVTAVNTVALLVLSSPVHSNALLASAVLAALASLIAYNRHQLWLGRTRMLFDRQDQLAQSRAEHDRAVRAEQDKSRFIATASHDLRQPMHALGLFVATLEQRLQHTPEATLVRNMMRAVESLDRSFSAVLDVSRIDAGALEPHQQHFALRDLFRRLHMHFAGQAEAAGLALRLAPGGKYVCSDPQLLERILGNLVQNAIKYTEHGGVVVVARSTRTHLNIEVWDTGIGIPANELPQIFDEFYQVGGHRRDTSGGLGMGLAIVKRLVQLLGHTLNVSSRPGRGSMFRIGIATSGLESDADFAPADTIPAPTFQARTVLVIDDEASIREGLRLLLEEWGFDAYTAADLAQARQVTERLGGCIDLMLCDLHLGNREDGLQAIELVRGIAQRTIPAIMITGDTSPAEIRRASASGNPVLFKPVQPRQLMAALRNVAV
jgi:signal transduction histidine kinase/CheY-like chemotaxis protein